ncbi:MAG: alpha/beta fold hydrolase [Candidatus Binataceae bacterium]|nr:alpha/beta fold hydrolase [Candidatus Binataceae bacterium]
MADVRFCSARDGIRLRYEIRGTGAPLVLVMGFSGSSRTWGEPFVQEIARRFQTVLIDNRGTGESDQPDQPWTIADMAADVAAVLDHARIARAHLYGISMGGMIAQEFALNSPDRLDRLVLGCTNCGLHDAVIGPPESTGALRPTPGITPAAQTRRLMEACCSRAFAASPQGQVFIEARIAEMANYPVTPMHTYKRQWAAIEGFGTLGRLAMIKAPTMVITGSEDPIVPAANADILQRHIPGAKAHVIEGAGHLFFWEAPEESAEVPGDFLLRA